MMSVIGPGLPSVMLQSFESSLAEGVETGAFVPLFGLSLLSAMPAQAVDALLARRACRAAFVNAHCVNLAFNDATYRAALDTADLLLPDGVGMDIAARWHSARFAANLNGTDLCPLLLTSAAQRGLSVFLLGGQNGVAADAARALVRRLPDLRVVGTLDGFSGADPDIAIPTINTSGADILLVAMGVPKQDIWLAQHAHVLRPRLVMGVGALFDFLACRVPRAPVWVRHARLEWAWRLAVEPRRMFGRYVIGNATFLWRAHRAARHLTVGQRQ